MNSRFLVSLLGLAALTLLTPPARAVPVEMNFEADLKVTSSYLWRGIVNEEVCAQPALIIRANEEYSLTTWGTWDLTDDETDSAEHTRMDVILDYAPTKDIHMGNFGVVAYIYRDTSAGRAQDTFEVYAGYTLDVVTLPSLRAYYDFSEIEGFYGTFSLAHSFELMKSRLWLDVKTSLGAADEAYNEAKFSYPANSDEKEFIPEGAGLVDSTTTVSLPIQINEQFMVAPSATYMTLLDSDIRDAADEFDEETDGFAGALTAIAYF